ncbi:hypothetical protein H2201_002170 [Coniosporium apollinis]|uniref:Amidohydrolase 3 domain-containing protein n=1 Tax=Coniosporium apollinis TaxID=61459 RepID=A0ABQ9NZ48_9PEZI|nr:hypothetical protein H2201_002170 [Coniosporium apollinis]
MAGAYLAAAGINLDEEMSKIQFGSLPTAPQSSSPFYPPQTSQSSSAVRLPLSRELTKVLGVRLPRKPPSTLWDVSLSDGVIESVTPHDPAARLGLRPTSSILDAHEAFLAPSLCHAHIHLDKPFLLSDPKFSDLSITDGSFDEAMTLTTAAKERFEEEDLLRRGRALIEESLAFGVTAMRAFVEVDGTVGMMDLDAGLKLKREFEGRCEVQIVAFAQLALFSGRNGGEEVRRLMREAAGREGVDVVGSTPYVEADLDREKQNLKWIFDLALEKGKMLDLHIDYHLDVEKEPLVWNALEVLREVNWEGKAGKSVCMGHCTRLTLFEESEWRRLRESIGSMPVSFVGLPTSDLYMMRTQDGRRGTLNVSEMIEKYGFQAAVAVNNVGNAYTPQGSSDPLSVASLGVGVYQAGTKKDADVLYECVSSRAKHMLGLAHSSLDLLPGEPADFVLFERQEVAWRTKKSIAEVVYDPPSRRRTIKGGRLVA